MSTNNVHMCTGLTGHVADLLCYNYFQGHGDAEASPGVNVLKNIRDRRGRNKIYWIYIH